MGFLPLVFILIVGGIIFLHDILMHTPEERAEKEASYRKQKELERLAEAARKEASRIAIGEMQGWTTDQLDGEYQFMSTLDKEKYMASPKWKHLRQIVIQRDKMCFTCKSQSGLNVHHIHYLRLGRENLCDLVALCEKCHSSLHKEKGYSRQGLYKPIGFEGFTPSYEELNQTTIDIDPLMTGLSSNLGEEIEFRSVSPSGTIRLGSLVAGCCNIPRCEFESTIELDFSGVFHAEHSLDLKSIHNLKNLKRLYLQDCLLKEIPEQIGELIYLEELDLRGNNLTHLPDFLGNLTSLRSLKLPKKSGYYYISPLLDGLPYLDYESKAAIAIKYSLEFDL